MCTCGSKSATFQLGTGAFQQLVRANKPESLHTTHHHMNLVNKQRPCANNVQNRDVVGQTSMTAPIEGNCTRARRVCNRAKASRCTQTPGTHSLPQLQSVRSLRNFRSAFNCADLQKPEGASGWYSRRRFHCGLMHIVELVTFRGKRQGNLVLVDDLSSTAGTKDIPVLSNH